MKQPKNLVEAGNIQRRSTIINLPSLRFDENGYWQVAPDTLTSWMPTRKTIFDIQTKTLVNILPHLFCAFAAAINTRNVRTRTMGYFRSTVMPLLLSQTGASTPSYKTAAVISTFRQFSKGRKFLVQFQFAFRDHRRAKSGLQRKSFRYPHLRTFIFIG